MMKISNKELISILYESILGREPDSEGIDYHTNRLKADSNISRLIAEFLYSDEFVDVFTKNKIQSCYSDFIEKKPKFKCYKKESEFKEELYKCALKVEDLSYLGVHQRRFYELNCMLAECMCGLNEPIVLEIGPSVATRIYCKTLDKFQLETIDRPVRMGGIDQKASITIGSKKHYNINLNDQSINSSNEHLLNKKYDYIICTEVLEHLLVSPFEFITDCLSLLKSTGFYYLTTPNFYSHHNIKKLEKFKNPQEFYPKKFENYDAHYHHREYEMKEMIELVESCNGEIIYAYWSDCWDNKNQDTRVPNCMLSNLVFLIKKRKKI